MTIAPAAPALPPAGRKRKHRSLTIEVSACLFLLAKEGAPLPLKPTSLSDWLDSCLRLLGIDPTKPWEVQHEPPLAARPFDDLTYDYVPRENDYRYMRPMQTPEHRAVTKAVDRPRVDKARRQGEGQAAHREAMLDKVIGEFPSEKAKLRAIAKLQKKKWAQGRPLQSRGFSSRPKKDGGNAER